MGDVVADWKRFVVGKHCEPPLASFDTVDEAEDYLASLLDQDGVKAGDYYLDDMKEHNG